ncbi:hypothetical protein MP477_09380 [Chryseobacterium sp. WG23]|uniref:hypothetical protein n=1 Tax=Chryseobacterium sp. WG23 TaxID=2926910 RepID=UPI00211F1172|nr:hypothetical protein [Chryseobacterium sp. WG23]MCQ9635162.1 hypothetical protein [Chryseobacterium sp. WG23]
MNLQKTRENFDKALENLIEHDYQLLQRNLSERSIAHKLAFYLTSLFAEYHVDCEYNGDVDSEGLRKILDIPREAMEELAVRSINKNDTYNIFPDIIVHKRETNQKNHLVVEMKKKNSYHKLKEYDFIKLKAFTRQYNYNLGIYLEVQTGDNYIISDVRYFQKGEERIEMQLEEF